jgi:hypothetical protein
VSDHSLVQPSVKLWPVQGSELDGIAPDLRVWIWDPHPRWAVPVWDGANGPAGTHLEVRSALQAGFHTAVPVTGSLPSPHKRDTTVISGLDTDSSFAVAHTGSARNDR